MRRRAYRVLAIGIDRPDVAVVPLGRQVLPHRQVRNAQGVRGDPRLRRVVSRHQRRRLAAVDANDDERARRGADGLREERLLGREHEPPALGKPRGVKTARRDAPHRLARSSHHEQTAAGPVRPKRDELAVGREGRHLIARRVVRQVDRRLAGDALQEEIAGLRIHDPLAVRRERWELLDAGRLRQPRVRRWRWRACGTLAAGAQPQPGREGDGEDAHPGRDPRPPRARRSRRRRDGANVARVERLLELFEIVPQVFR